MLWDDALLLQVLGAIEALEKAMASTALGRREKVLRAIADVEERLEFLAQACEDPSLRQIVSARFKHLEASMAHLAVAAHVVPPEPEGVGQ